MAMIKKSIPSNFDQLPLAMAIIHPHDTPKAIIQFSHGMAEHKERYLDFMNHLAALGYICIIHDHRGHGESVLSEQDYGYFYTEDEHAIIEDLHTVTVFAKEQYPDLPVYLFAHSMGTLVARGYLKKYDDEIEKLVLCGPPTYNVVAGFGIMVANICKNIWGKRTPNKLLNSLAFLGYNKGKEGPMSWLSVNEENVKTYLQNQKCGYIFTTNGFLNLFKLQKGAFVTKDWSVKNEQLPILLIAGEDDPVIQSLKKLKGLQEFLRKLGYQTVNCKTYPGLRHELLNETNHREVYWDVTLFFENTQSVEPVSQRL